MSLECFFCGYDIKTMNAPPQEKKRKREDGNESGSSERITITQLTPSQLIGKNCVLCNTKRSPKSCGMPHIHVGQYRKVLICKKGHLVDPNERSQAQDILTQILDAIKKDGDGDVDVFTNGSEGDNSNSDGDEPGSRLQCAGFRDTASEKNCDQTGDRLLFTVEENFCRPSHLLRRLLVHNCAHK
jgi:hypothetical protein